MRAEKNFRQLHQDSRVSYRLGLKILKHNGRVLYLMGLIFADLGLIRENKSHWKFGKGPSAKINSREKLAIREMFYFYYFFIFVYMRKHNPRKRSNTRYACLQQIFFV